MMQKLAEVFVEPFIIQHQAAHVRESATLLRNRNGRHGLM